MVLKIIKCIFTHCIKNLINTNNDITNIDTRNHYSTSETWTGQYWTDRKKIYQKVFPSVDIVDGWTTRTINDVDKMLFMWGWSRHKTNVNSTQFCVPYVPINGSYGIVLEYTPSSNTVGLGGKPNMVGWTVDIICEYTKIAD